MRRRLRRALTALKAVRINALDPMEWLQAQEREAREATQQLRTGGICPYVSSEPHDRITGAYRRQNGGAHRDRD